VVALERQEPLALLELERVQDEPVAAQSRPIFPRTSLRRAPDRTCRRSRPRPRT